MVRLFIQSPFDQAIDGPCMSILSHKQTIGLAFIAQSGLISAVAVIGFLLVVARNYIRNITNPPPGKWRLIRTHVDAYMLSLLVADLLQSIGAILTAKWAIEQRTYCSNYCTAQGIIQQVGETGVAMSTLAITFHTFFTVFFHFKPPQWVWMVVVSVIWLFLGGFTATSYLTSKTAFYAPTPFWCWVSDHYDDQRLFAEYMWMWLAAFTNIILYIPLYFCVRGNIVVNPVSKRITFRFRKNKGLNWEMGGGALAAHGVKGPGLNKEALKLIWYPISYTALVLPISVARWSSFPTVEDTPVNQLPILKTSITVFIFGLSGLVNVLVFMSTRPHLLLFGPRRGLVSDNVHRPGFGSTSPPSFMTTIDSTRSNYPLAKSPLPRTPSTGSGKGSGSSTRYPYISSPSPSPSPYNVMNITAPSPSMDPKFDIAPITPRRPASATSHRRRSSELILQDLPLPSVQLQRPPERIMRRTSTRDSWASEGAESFGAGSTERHHHQTDIELTGAWHPDNYSVVDDHHEHAAQTYRPTPSPPPPMMSQVRTHRPRQSSGDTVAFGTGPFDDRVEQYGRMGMIPEVDDREARFQSSRYQV